MNENNSSIEEQETYVFTNLYYLKKHLLMLQNVKNDEFCHYIDDLWKKFKTKVDFNEFNIWQLNTMIQDFDNRFIKRKIREELLEEWEYSDYDVYTDKYYHRKFWNEIPNPDVIQEIFIKICEVLNVNNAEFKYMLCLYDFNEKEMYFKTEKDMIDFIIKYYLAPCVAYVLKNGHYTEMWSM